MGRPGEGHIGENSLFVPLICPAGRLVFSLPYSVPLSSEERHSSFERTLSITESHLNSSRWDEPFVEVVHRSKDIPIGTTDLGPLLLKSFEFPDISWLFRSWSQ
jgi:hypothetical protein